jgi:hypothetical protein
VVGFAGRCRVEGPEELARKVREIAEGVLESERDVRN